MPDYAKKAPGVYVEQVPSGAAPIAGVGTSTAGFIGVVPSTIQVPNPAYDPAVTDPADPRSRQNIPAAGLREAVLVTNFTEFKSAFGDFSADPGQSLLAHAVYGFFQNGGTRCWVTRVEPGSGPDNKPDYANVSIADALQLFEPIDEIAIVAAPGLATSVQTSALDAHCKRMETCVAVLDTVEVMPAFGEALRKGSPALPANSDYSALYFPWIEVYDPASKGRKMVPPSGHVAGIYARIDAQRGVHKAPGNEIILGALGVKYPISRSQQDGLNAHGVNCIRNINGNIRVWGARTLGGDANLDFKYISVRRLFNYLRESIDQGTQWAVFEPNNQELWAKITRNVSAFLANVWAAGALFGDKPEEAFYVKCDAETNPPSLRDLGQVTTEVGVAITRPAEFVVFKLGQKAAT
jgi:phage tail sheath protein FI